MTDLQLPAYFLDGPHAGKVMNIGKPHRYLFAVPPDPYQWPWDLSTTDEDLLSRFPAVKTDEYDLQGAVLLYKYAGRF